MRSLPRCSFWVSLAVAILALLPCQVFSEPTTLDTLKADPPALDGYVRIKAGTFQMGSPTSEEGREGDETQHPVTLTRDYIMKTTEVTQAEWRAVMANSPSHFSSCGDDCPVENVSWYDALAYLNALSKSKGVEACYELSACSGTAGGGCSASEMGCNGDHTCTVKFKGLDCKGYRLPTEAEWEYAARADSAGAFSDPSSPEAVAWTTGNADAKTHAVAQKSANAWGLYGVHGNVWEWTGDWYGDYPAEATDPQGADSGSGRVTRGGSWGDEAQYCRSASRNGFEPASRSSVLGLRPARSVD